MTQAATVEQALEAVTVVCAGQGIELGEERLATVAMMVAAAGWKAAELREAAQVLALDPDLRDSVRYGRTLSPADFEAVRQGRVRRTEDGEVTEHTAASRRIARARLMSFNEARAAWQRMGSPGRFSDSRTVGYPDSAFEVVDVDGKAFFRLKA